MLRSGKYRRAYSKQALYTSTALNQYSSISQGSQTPFTPSYDADGNQSTLQTSTGEWTVSYNVLNQATSFTQGSKRILCVYDYLNRRIEKALYEGDSLIYRKRFIYRGYLQIAELDASTENAIPRKTYLWDPSETNATRVLIMSLFDATGSYEEDLYYTHDAQKNTNALFGIKAGRRALYLYGAYGNLIKIDGAIASLNPFRFSCEYHDDELALIYYNYRYLNPKDGRWINRDPIQEQGGINLYVAYKNNPITWYDVIGGFALSDFLLPGTFEIDIPTTVPALSIVFTLNVSKSKSCMKYTISGGITFSIKNSIMKKLKLLPLLGKQMAHYIEKQKLADLSVQGFISGSGSYCSNGTLETNTDCPGFCELSFTISFTLGNGAHGGGNGKGGIDGGIWGDGKGTLNFCKGTLTADGGFNIAGSANYEWIAYNREWNFDRAVLVGPDGWLNEGGPYDFLIWKN